MPFDKKQYQKDYMARKRQQSPEKPPENPGISPYHQHYWLRKIGESEAVCTTFGRTVVVGGKEIFQGTIGCGAREPYKGVGLPIFTDGLPEWGDIGMGQKEIDNILNHPAVKTGRRDQ